MAMKFVVEQGEEEYRIVAWRSAVGNPDKPDFEGEWEEYGSGVPAEIECDGKMYIALCDWDQTNDKEIESLLPIDGWVALVTPVPATILDVEVEGEDEPEPKDVAAAIAEIEGDDEGEDSEDDGEDEEEDEGPDA